MDSRFVQSAFSFNEDASLVSSCTSNSTSSDDELSNVPEPRDEVKEVHKLAMSETKGVRVWRIVVMLSILVTGCLVSSGTYLFLQNEQEESFKNGYLVFTHSIKDATQVHVKNLLGAFRGLSEVITAHAIASNSSFPFVTLPSFEVTGWVQRQRSGIEVFAYSPLVTDAHREQWEAYATANQDWLAESRTIAVGRRDHNGWHAAEAINRSNFITGDILPWIYQRKDENDLAVPSPGPGPYAPVWQISSPPFSPDTLNFDLLSEQGNRRLSSTAIWVRESVIGPVKKGFFFSGKSVSEQDHNRWHAQYVTALNATSAFDHPHSLMFQPVFSKLNDPMSEVVGFVTPVLPWDRFVAELLPHSVNGIYCIVQNTCGQAFTYLLNGNSAVYVGPGDHHVGYNDMEVAIPFSDYLYPNSTSQTEGHCAYSFHIYPSAAFEESYETMTPEIFTALAATTFALMAVAFCTYDMFVQRRNTKVVGAAARSNQIVSSMFPSTVRDRVFEQQQQQAEKKRAVLAHHSDGQPQKSRLKSFLNGDENVQGVEDNRTTTNSAIADLFPETTVLFADIAGFTAWSSAREPAQVFTLLETLFGAFDDIASKRRVYKVETVGDCYVAVVGLPDPRKDHSVVMARFARDCMRCMHSLGRKLEVTLGPDTAELRLRVGIHSGPVTAGVLRGQRSRFQLFGDTMNTASRMESTGVVGKIQVSQETASLLQDAGKGNWICPRSDTVVAKGKGELQTYWLLLGEQNSDSASNRSVSEQSSSVSQIADDFVSKDSDKAQVSNGGKTSFSGDGPNHDNTAGKSCSGKAKRLIDWNVDLLVRQLKRVVARRNVASSTRKMSLTVTAGTNEEITTSATEEASSHSEGHTVLDDVVEIIDLPEFDHQAAVAAAQDPNSIALDPVIVAQLRDYVTSVQFMYHDDNPFHNFEHASHVVMSVSKLLSRIVKPALGCMNSSAEKMDHSIGYSFTISDPLTQFACHFSALIHDVDHSGVPNATLVKEGTKLAQFYHTSIAEQNSVDLALNLLADAKYAELRAAIYATPHERAQFRQIVINSVMATDILEKSLIRARNERWERAFSSEGPSCPSVDDNAINCKATMNRKATIVIEHLIQASDVSHTMQHWHIYRKWNAQLFREQYGAYMKGRADQNPADYWYQGEIGFLSHYVIPLAMKLRSCGVFGVSSDEYLNYAKQNLQEWERKGQDIVAEIVETLRKE